MAEGSSGHHPGGNRRPHRTGHHQLHNLSFQPMIEESFPLFTADEEVASERELLKSVEDGPYMPGSIPKACPCFDVESEYGFLEK